MLRTADEKRIAVVQVRSKKDVNDNSCTSWE